jgi:hypothetical protein
MSTKVARRQQTCVVHQDVQPPAGGDAEFTQCAPPRLDIGDVHDRGPYRPIVLCRVIFQRIQPGLVDVDRADGIPGSGEPAHDRQADAAGGAGDEHRLRCRHGPAQ